MEVISESQLRKYWKKHHQAKAPLEDWLAKTRAAHWTKIDEVRQTFSAADPVTTKKGRKTTVFNIGGNSFRLIAAIDYKHARVTLLEFMTHGEYSKDRWKDKL